MLTSPNDIQGCPGQPFVDEDGFVRPVQYFRLPLLAHLGIWHVSGPHDRLRNYAYLETDVLEQSEERPQLRGTERRIHDLPMSLVNFSCKARFPIDLQVLQGNVHTFVPATDTIPGPRKSFVNWAISRRFM